MDEESRKKKGVFGGPSKKRGSNNKEETRMLERFPSRRKLNSYQLSPPDYAIDAKILIDEYVEKEVKYAGTISNVPAALDSTNRTDILRIIDEGRKNKVIPWVLTAEHDAILSLSVNNIKISRRDGAEELLVRIPIYEVATICYIQDDAHHYLALKYGNPDKSQEFCHLAVLYGTNRGASEELCSLVGQCFQHVYTEATLGELDLAISGKVSNSSYGYDLDIFSQSVNKDQSSTTSTIPAQQANRKGSDSDLDETLQEYITMLQKDMTHDELHTLNSLLTPDSDMPFQEFCAQVLTLYGPKRKHLLTGLRKFIAPENYHQFDLFLRKNGILETGNGNTSLSSDGSRSIYRRTISDASQSSFGNNTMYGDRDSFGHEAIDHIINDFSQKYNSVSIDTNPKTYMPT